MSTPVATLEEGLQAMLALKPPGVRGSIINNLRDLCVNNIQSESVLIQKLYTHFKKTPGTHKLGVLYVVDLVSRKWSDQARALGQEINSSAADGTFGAGVHRITELLPVFLHDTIDSAPEDQKEKIKKLIDIWSKYETFSEPLLASFRSKLESTTPPGDPPPSANIFGFSPAAPTNAPPTAPPGTAQPVPSDILASLAILAKQTNAAQLPTPANNTPAPVPAPPVQGSYAYPASAPPTTNPTVPPPLPMNFQMPSGVPSYPPATQQAVGPPPAAPFPFPPPAQNSQYPFPGAPPAITSSQAPPVHAAAAPPPAAAPAPVDPKFQQQLALIQALVAQGMSTEQITQIVTSLNANQSAVPTPPAAAPVLPPGQNAQYAPPAQNNYQSAPQQQPWNPPNHAESPRDRAMQGNRSPPRQRGRSRSRSPDGRWGSRDSRSGRDGRIGEYGRRPSPGRGRPDTRDGRAPDGGSYRQRSPPRRNSNQVPGSDRWIERDPKVPYDHIKVYSRTLFVGGVTCSESALQEIFSRFGRVQTCIVNTDKRHAFVKLYNREDAVKAKEGMESLRNSDMQLRTRWGVGYGPRDCSDYQTGVSVIPIARLTDADRKWMLTAEFGGTGGLPMEGGWAVEEPDIEIGAGVSSKAISRRIATDRGGRTGPRSSRRDDDNGPPHGGPGNRGGHDGGSGRFNRRGRGDNFNNRRNDDRRNGNNHMSGPNNGNSNGEPVVADFPYGLATNANGFPIMPPGFSFPAP